MKLSAVNEFRCLLGKRIRLILDTEFVHDLNSRELAHVRNRN